MFDKFTGVLRFGGGLCGSGSAGECSVSGLPESFDKVSHEKLVLKMKRMGLEDWFVRWIGNWLSDRRQRVVVNGVASGWEIKG